MSDRTSSRAFSAAALILWAIAVPAGQVAAQATRDSLPATRDSGLAVRAGSLDEVVVTATRTSQVVRSLPANVTVLTTEAFETSPAMMVPGTLLRLPGYSGRHFGSPLVTNAPYAVPSFRGLGGSTGGRTLLLLDGVPVNDPFNSWVWWSRIPPAVVGRIEVVRGGGSMAWGSRALGGVINIMTRNPSAGRHLEGMMEAGGHGTYHGSVGGSVSQGRFGVQVAGDWLTTDGFVNIRPDQAGPIDIPRERTSKVGYGRVNFEASQQVRLFLSGNYMDERQGGGTPAVSGFTGIGEVRGGGDIVLGTGVLRALAYRYQGSYVNPSSSVSADRTTERPRAFTRVPSDAFGASLQWSQVLAERHDFSAGVDIGQVKGTFRQDYVFVGDQATRRLEVGGRQWLGGVFVTDAVELADRWRIIAGVRWDHFVDGEGSRVESSLLTGQAALDTSFAVRTESALNYNLGIRHEAGGGLTLRASTYQSFRAPVLSELYQPFYAGTGSTLESNPDLGPERMLGAEIGADVEAGRTVLARVTGFWNRVRDPIIDYTVGRASSTGQVIEPCGVMVEGQVCKQRRNVDGLTSIGIEAEAEWHPAPRLAAWMAYTFNSTRVSAPGQAVNEKSARGAPRHAVTGLVTWSHPAVAEIAAEIRHVGGRYDDDVNTIDLASFTVLGVRVNRSLGPGLNAFLKVDNLFDAQYDVTRAANGLTEIGGPRWVVLGLKAAW